MNRLTKLIWIILPMAFFANADTGKQDYKCFIESAKGVQVVFYRWVSDELLLKMAAMPSSQLTDNKGKRYFIKEVAECVPLNDDFTTEQAKKLDKQTLR
jgi:hypothetical protein